MVFDNLTGLGYGIITFAIVIGIGVVVLTRFGGAVASCPTISGNTSSWNVTSNQCAFANGSQFDPTNDAWVTTNYLVGQMGESGLAGWTPAIIALVVGMLFLGMFLARKGGRKA